MARATRGLRTSVRLYRTLLVLLPARLRLQRGGEIVDLFRDLYEDHVERSGCRGALEVWRRALSGLARVAATERMRSRRQFTPPQPGDNMFARLFADLRLAGRTLLRTPAFTGATLLTLALGIGATTAVFSIVYAVIVRGLPYDEAENLVYIDHKAPPLGFESGLGSGPGLYYHYRQNSHVIESLGYWTDYESTITGDGQEPERVATTELTSDLFTTLRVTPLHGRLFSVVDDEPGPERSVILAHGLWQRRFGGDPEVVNRDIEVEGRRYPIVGILPADFHLTDSELFLDNRWDFTRDFGGFNGKSIARVAAGTSLSALRDDLDAQLTHANETFDDPQIAAVIREAAVATVPVPLKEWIVGPVARTLWVLMGTVGFVLLTACANVANLFLVRAEGRQRETAVRQALGASRFQVLRGYLAESMVLAAAGGTLGVILATVGVRGLLRWIPFTLPRANEIGLDWGVLLFAAGISVGAGILFACFTALRRPAVGEVLRASGRSHTADSTRVRARQLLAGVQIALSLILLTGAGLMARSFDRLANVELGFVADGVLTFQLRLPGSRYPEATDVVTFHQDLLERLTTLPGITAAAATRDLPLGGVSDGELVEVEDDPLPEGEISPVLWVNRATPGYFEVAGIPRLSGRGFERADAADRRDVIVVNQAAADTYFRGEDPIGRRMRTSLDAGAPWLEVIGVVGTTKQQSLSEGATPMAWVHLAHAGSNSAHAMAYALTVSGDELAVADAVRAAVHAADAQLPIIQMQTLSQIVDDAGAPMAFTMTLLGIAAAVAVLLGSIGVYGVIAYVVRHRTGEIGIRMALGADGGDVRRLLLRQGIAVAVTGVGVGLAGTFSLVRALESLLYGIDPLDPLTHLASCVFLIIVVALATWVPAVRASRLDPVEALRDA